MKISDILVLAIEIENDNFDVRSFSFFNSIFSSKCWSNLKIKIKKKFEVSTTNEPGINNYSTIARRKRKIFKQVERGILGSCGRIESCF